MILLPKYKPRQWVIYLDQNNGMSFGYILAGDFADHREFKGWQYWVGNENQEPGVTGEHVRENEILGFFDDGNWHRSDKPASKRAERGLYL